MGLWYFSFSHIRCFHEHKLFGFSAYLESTMGWAYALVNFHSEFLLSKNAIKWSNNPNIWKDGKMVQFALAYKIPRRHQYSSSQKKERTQFVLDFCFSDPDIRTPRKRSSQLFLIIFNFRICWHRFSDPIAISVLGRKVHVGVSSYELDLRHNFY